MLTLFIEHVEEWRIKLQIENRLVMSFMQMLSSVVFSVEFIQRFPLANIRSSDIGDRTEYVNTILEYQPAGVII